MTSDDFTLFTDASGALGFGVVYRSHWFSSPWPTHLKHHSINFKELCAIVVSAQTWGHSWRNRQVSSCLTTSLSAGNLSPLGIPISCVCFVFYFFTQQSLILTCFSTFLVTPIILLPYFLVYRCTSSSKQPDRIQSHCYSTCRGHLTNLAHHFFAQIHWLTVTNNFSASTLHCQPYLWLNTL